ncbi:MAG TPA: glucose 1-dehydrogenase [Bryobacteraceae bacterium]|jgi:threonine dehydrogenase-like Zn-dependent dehydrogenase|nr:glucose 1-dehydrogenase [Bryobacteraceae bacterium]
MKAFAVFPAKRESRLVDHPEPKVIAHTEAKIRVLDVGVCGTDREIVSFEYGDPPEGYEYLVIGHESLSEVVEVADQVSRVKPGDLVVTTVRRPCSHPDCIACREGRQDFCYTGDFTERGIKSRHGFMTELVVEEERYLNVVPRSLRDVGVLVEPLTIAEKSLEQLAQVQQRLPWATPMEPGQATGAGRRAVVLGAGPVGLLGAMALRISGYEVAVYSRSREGADRNEIVAAIGGQYIPAEKYAVNQLPALAGPIDVVYEATGASALAFEVLKYLGSNSVFIFTGVPGHKPPIPINTDQIMRGMVLNNQAIVGSVNAPPHCFQAAINHLGIFMGQWPNALRSLITRRFPIEQAMEPLASGAGGVKNVIAIAS